MEGVILYLLRKELSKIEKGRIEHIYRAHDHLFFFLISTKRGSLYLTLDLTERPITYISSKIEKKELQDAPAWEGFLVNWVIDEISQDDWNRVYILKLMKKQESRYLYLEFTGRFSNMILTDRENKIITALKPMGFSLDNAKRVVRGGFTYKLPEFRKKYFPWEVDLRSLFSSYEYVKDLLLNTLKGIGRNTAEDILLYLEYDRDVKTASFSETDIERLSFFLGDIYKKWMEYEYTPYIIYGPQKDIKRLTLIPIEEAEAVDSISHALSLVHNDMWKKNILKAKKQRFLRLLNGNIESLKKKLEHIKKELSSAEHAEEFLQKGELLKVNLSKIRKGMDKIKVINYYKYPPEEEYIELNPELTPKENVDMYFKRYAKYKRGKEKLEKLYNHILSEIDRVTRLRDALKDGENIFWIEEELRNIGLIKEERAPILYKGEKVKIKRFTSPDGFLILVGRSAKENEMVLKLASPNDYWLHVRDIPGSHVIIKRNGKKEVPFSTIRYAASIAAYFSKARGDTNVGVDYTLRKYVRPIKGGGPGFVNFREEKTIYVDPSDFKKLQASSKVT